MSCSLTWLGNRLASFSGSLLVIHFLLFNSCHSVIWTYHIFIVLKFENKSLIFVLAGFILEEILRDFSVNESFQKSYLRCTGNRSGKWNQGSSYNKSEKTFIKFQTFVFMTLWYKAYLSMQIIYKKKSNISTHFITADL